MNGGGQAGTVAVLATTATALPAWLERRQDTSVPLQPLIRVIQKSIWIWEAMPVAAERLSDHCPVVVEIQDRDLD